MKIRLLISSFMLAFLLFFVGCELIVVEPDYIPDSPFYVKLEKVSEAVNGNLVEGWLLKPRRSNGKGIIYAHGGFWSLAPGQHYPDAQIYALIGGYYVFIIDYEGRSDISKQSPLRDIVEVTDAATLLRRKTGITKEINGIGVSRGGYVITRALVDYKNVFKKIINLMGPINMVGYNWSVWGAQSPQHKQMVEQAKAYFAKTPDPYQLALQGRYDTLGSRMLLLYGDKDILCPPQNMCLPFVERTGARFKVFNGVSHSVHRLTDAQEIALGWLMK